MMRFAPGAAAATLLVAPVSTSAQQVEVIPLSEWRYDEFVGSSWSVEELMDEAEVYGAGGEEIGDVENIVFSENGSILSLIAEVGGFIDIGDTHVSVPWEQVDVSDDLDRIDVPISEENVEDYSLFGEYGYLTAQETQQSQVVGDELRVGPRAWKATDLMGDYARLEDAVNYGYVDDLLVSMDGQLEAVVVEPDVGVGGGPYALPYYGYRYGWDPALDFYDVPYAEAEIAELEPLQQDLD